MKMKISILKLINNAYTNRQSMNVKYLTDVEKIPI